MTKGAPVCVWLGSLVGLGSLSLVFLEIFHSGWITDVCDRPEANPRTDATFLLVGLSIVVPFGLALACRRVGLMAAAGVMAVLSALIWWWLLSPVPC